MHRPPAARYRAGPAPDRRAAALGLALIAAACSATPDDLADGVIELPGQLREVSGIALVDDRTLACVQDEVGAVFFVDLRGELPPRKVSFGEKGDYEGLARVGADFWVLRSDGLLLRLVADGDRLRIAARHPLRLEHREYEGLCFDAAAGRLLVAPKDPPAAGKVERRRIYAFDLAGERWLAAPVLDLAVPAVAAALPAALAGHAATGRATLRLLPSEVGVRPGEVGVWLLSAADHLLLQFAPDGALQRAVRLDPKRLPQPEGLAFLPDGRVLVASEGRGTPASVRVVSLE